MTAPLQLSTLADTRPFTFYLGTHHPGWLSETATPLFVSRRRLTSYRNMPRRKVDDAGQPSPWALDSGGFTELNMHGRWETTPEQYVAEVRRFQEVGGLQWAAIQDWMCEPFVLAKTGLSVEEHQRRTVTSYETLLDLAPDLPWAPVLQGWEREDYYRHADLYASRGHRLESLPIVGVGSVCRRQSTDMAERLLRDLKARGLHCHGFGFKQLGLKRVHDALTSSDSMAWSFNARKNAPLPECVGKHKNCANCRVFAERWMHDLLAGLQKKQPARHSRPIQTSLFDLFEAA